MTNIEEAVRASRKWFNENSDNNLELIAFGDFAELIDVAFLAGFYGGVAHENENWCKSEEG